MKERTQEELLHYVQEGGGLPVGTLPYNHVISGEPVFHPPLACVRTLHFAFCSFRAAEVNKRICEWRTSSSLALANTTWNVIAVDLLKELPDACVDLICSDPPYTQGTAAPADPKVCSYQNVAWAESEWHKLLHHGERVLRKGGKHLIFCSNTLRRQLEAQALHKLQ